MIDSNGYVLLFNAPLENRPNHADTLVNNPAGEAAVDELLAKRLQPQRRKVRGKRLAVGRFQGGERITDLHEREPVGSPCFW